MIIFPHVPKTGGTSMRRSLERALGDRLLLDYDTPPGRPTVPLWRRAGKAVTAGARRRALARRYDVIFGHFSADLYRLTGAPTAMFFREPCARLLSDYHYTVANGKDVGSIEDFARRPTQIRQYPMYLGARTVAGLEFVGITECYSDSLVLFARMFGIRLDEARQRVGTYDVTPTALRAVAALQTRNRVVYDAARRRFDMLCKIHL